VLEQTKLNHDNQIVTFIGAAELPGPNGEPLQATTDQPIFHVEHSVGGTETPTPEPLAHRPPHDRARPPGSPRR
jgi:hypothetical protein